MPLHKAAELFVAAILASTVQTAPTLSPREDDDPFKILDPQKWVNPDNMTWDDFKAPPNTDWSNPARKGSIRNFNIAMVAVDYPDLPFTITLPVGSTPFGNPQPIVSGLSRDDVPSFYRDLLNLPQALNHNHTLHEYWMEDSAGRYGVDLTVFGAYRMPAKFWQYGVDDDPDYGFNPGACPEQPCSVDLRTDALGAWRADVGDATADSFELAFILSAGQDESSSWQEFGPMKFLSKENVTDDFGPPDNSSLPNWAKTRYVEWTSWASAATIWPNAADGSSLQAESDGAATYAHELSHLLGIGDNYNNPYGIPARRSYTGPWSMMSRGSFNGPGGPHTRWQIPSLQGATMGSLHTVRDKLQLGLTTNSSVLMVQKSALAQSGVIVANVTARSVDVGTNGLLGVRIIFGTDLSPSCNTSTDAFCDGGGYNNYEIEVVDRMGADSFTPDSGVMISKSKISDRTQPFQWVIDANPQDINVVDFIKPDGTPQYLTVGDYRQLADALFHAGTRSGSEFEHIDTANGIHLYVIDPHRSSTGVLSYTVGVRSTANSTSISAGVELTSGSVASNGDPAGSGTSCVFSLSNTGTQPMSADASLASYTKNDLYRLSASIECEGWRVELPNALAVAEYGGGTTEVRVAVGASEDAESEAVVTLVATSESDPSVSATQECKVTKKKY